MADTRCRPIPLPPAIPPPPPARWARRAVATVAAAFALGGCGALYSPYSPDVSYSPDAAEARRLQVPPDLTDVRDEEQFVLPGSEGGTLARNTLLPVFDDVSFVREGAASWLAFERPPEDLWPRLLAFLRRERYRVERTEPTAGTVYTQWRAAEPGGGGSLLGGLIGGDDEYSRIGFRLERAADGGARLFARVQTAAEDVVEGGETLPWPSASADPEASGALLARLLVFLGVEEQRARGLIDAERAASVLDPAVVTSDAAGNHLIVNLGYEVAFRAVREALDALGHEVSASDEGVGRIDYVVAGVPRVLTFTPLHVGAVRVALGDADGRRLAREREREALEALAATLA